MKNPKKRPSWIRKLRNRYRLMLINESNFQEKATIRLTPLSVLMLFLGGFLLFFLISWLMIVAIPPLRVYMPGYEHDRDRKQKKELLATLNDIENSIHKLEEKKVLLDMLLRGDKLTKTDIAMLQDQIDVNTEYKEHEKIISNDSSNDDKAQASTLFMEPSENVFAYTAEQSGLSQMSGLFYPPITGKVTSVFEASQHPAIDIVPNKDETVKAALDGTVILTGWTPDFGNVVCIQHPDNWMTVYKHCAQVFSKRGARVNAGEVIGVVGNTGNLSSGPHLHFELWHNGITLNPLNFIRFN
ncbi:MAG: M23 family metallopeptidase [Bacteroidia bacterium]|nr:M23 family metallopeptidase [Bacteroidia bacterium]MCO5253702.1 M23 family metallopeptidase [Bacteroidota bacterium]MCZ2129146.1 M23 family metallopeptidase [Bacteroidia bacterium]